MPEVAGARSTVRYEAARRGARGMKARQPCSQNTEETRSYECLPPGESTWGAARTMRLGTATISTSTFSIPSTATGWDGAADHSPISARGAHVNNDTNHIRREIEEGNYLFGKRREAVSQHDYNLAVIRWHSHSQRVLGGAADAARRDGESIGYSLAPRRGSVSSTSTGEMAGQRRKVAAVLLPDVIGTIRWSTCSLLRLAAQRSPVRARTRCMWRPSTPGVALAIRPTDVMCRKAT